MGWKKIQDGVTPGWYEDITATAGGTDDTSSSIIDFIPAPFIPSIKSDLSPSNTLYNRNFEG